MAEPEMNAEGVCRVCHAPIVFKGEWLHVTGEPDHAADALKPEHRRPASG